MVIEIRTTAKLRQWGNSIGIVIPKEEIARAGLAVGDEIEVRATPKQNALRKIWGSAKFTRPTADILRDVDRELDPDLVKRR